MRARVVWCALLLLTLATPAAAQHGGRVSVVGNLGVLFPMMDHPQVAKFDAGPALLSGAMLNYGVSDLFGLQFGLLVSEQQIKTGGDEKNKMTLQEMVMQFRWNILTGLWQPYLTAGVNYYVISLDPPLDDESDPGVNFGGGLELIFTDHISFGVTGRYSYVFVEHFDAGAMASCLATLSFTF